MVDSIDELKPGEKPEQSEPLTKDNWLGYWINEIHQDATFLIGHQDGNDRITCGLEKILKQAQDFDQLKAELLKFIQERKEFSKDLEEKWDGDTPEKWHLPRPL